MVFLNTEESFIDFVGVIKKMIKILKQIDKRFFYILEKNVELLLITILF